MWDVGDDHSFMHDQISTDKQNPNVNAGGPNYAVNAGHGQLVVMDQADNNTYAIDIPTRESKDKVPSRFPSPNRPSMFWGDEHLWSNPPYDPADPHNPMIDSKGRVWMTSKLRGRVREQGGFVGDALAGVDLEGVLRERSLRVRDEIRAAEATAKE